MEPIVLYGSVFAGGVGLGICFIAMLILNSWPEGKENGSESAFGIRKLVCITALLAGIVAGGKIGSVVVGVLLLPICFCTRHVSKQETCF